MRRLFIVGWLCSLVFVALCWLWWTAPLAVAQDAGDLAVLSGVIALLPWAAGPGLMPVLRRMKSGGVNLPHNEYWFSGERRAASLDRLGPFMDALGLMLSAFLCGMLSIDLVHGLHGHRPSEAVHMAATAAFLLVTGLWVWRVMRAFPAPPREAAGSNGDRKPSPAPTRRAPVRRRGQP
jgi:hypothetical protein